MAKLEEGPIQRLEPALEPLTKGLAPGAPVQKKTAEDCMVAAGRTPCLACPVCGAFGLAPCKL